MAVSCFADSQLPSPNRMQARRCLWFFAVAAFDYISVLYPASFFLLLLAAWSQKQCLSWPDNTICQPTKMPTSTSTNQPNEHAEYQYSTALEPVGQFDCPRKDRLHFVKASRAMGVERQRYFYFIFQFLCLVSSGVLNQAVATRRTCLNRAKAQQRKDHSGAGAPE